jgi:hypothetical protein
MTLLLIVLLVALIFEHISALHETAKRRVNVDHSL